jgi:CIC family chloride channel protein
MMQKQQLRLAVRISQKLERALGGEHIYFLALAAIVGILGGFGAVLFRKMIELVNHLAFPLGFSLEALEATPWYWKVIPPAVGGLVVGPLVHFLASEAKGHGIPEVMNAVTNNGGKIRTRVMGVKILASAITIGTGGSVGREGPIAQIGAGLGSSIGRALGFDGNKLIIMLGCGAAAGMAATFNAPIGGVMLAIEVIIGSASISIFSPLVVASVMGTVVTRIMYPHETVFLDVPEYHLVSVVELPLYVVLGVIAGLGALLFTRGTCFFEDLWERVPLPAGMNAVIGGAAVGGIALVFPEVLGVGYEAMHVPLHSGGTFFMLIALVFVKLLATGTTLGSGGSGGVFAPSLFIGACLGGAFGIAMEHLLPGQTASSGAYALVGMGAVMAGATHAPITAIIMLFELTNDYQIILPLMLSCIVSVVLASKVLDTSVFTIKLRRRGVRLRASEEAALMRNTKVRRLLRPFPETMGPSDPISQVIQKVLSGSMEHKYVVDGENRLLGVINIEQLRTILTERDLDEQLLLAADVMNPKPTTVTLDDTLDTTMFHLSRLDTEMLPVVDKQGKLAGSITQKDMMVFIEYEVLKDEDLGLKFVPKGNPEDARFIEVPEGHVIGSIKITKFLAGQTLKQLDLRATVGINVVGIKRPTPEGIKRLSPDPTRPLAEGDIIIAVGDRQAITSLAKSMT